MSRTRDALRSSFIRLGRRAPALFTVYLGIARGWRGQPGVLVFSDGHAGTSSLMLSLRKGGIPYADHVHFLAARTLDEGLHYPRGVGWIYRKLFVEQQRPVKMISMIRDPVDRAVSKFFSHQYGHRIDVPSVSLEDLSEQFEGYFNTRDNSDWFESEMLPAIGLDVYQYCFPKAKGFLRIEHGNIELLLLRLELADEAKEEIVADFVGLDSLTWERLGQVGEQKAYGSLYRKFKDQGRVTEVCLEGLLMTRSARHFLTEEEVEKSIRKWSRTA